MKIYRLKYDIYIYTDGLVTEIYLKSFRTVELSSFNFDKVEHSYRNFSNNVFPQICAFKLAVLTLKKMTKKTITRFGVLILHFLKHCFCCKRNAISKNLNYSFVKCIELIQNMNSDHV